jgi:hypothetical protein
MRNYHLPWCILTEAIQDLVGPAEQSNFFGVPIVTDGLIQLLRVMARYVPVEGTPP